VSAFEALFQDGERAEAQRGDGDAMGAQDRDDLLDPLVADVGEDLGEGGGVGELQRAPARDLPAPPGGEEPLDGASGAVCGGGSTDPVPRSARAR
jgi:hypothetical protein